MYKNIKQLPEIFKIKVNPKQSKALQEHLFSIGKGWASRDQFVQHTEWELLNYEMGLFRVSTLEHFNRIAPKRIKFKDYYQKERFTLPEKWCILRTPENYEMVNKWCNENRLEEESSNYQCDSGYIHSNKINGSTSFKRGDYQEIKSEGYRELTTEQFKRYVVNAPKEKPKPINKESLEALKVISETINKMIDLKSKEIELRKLPKLENGTIECDPRKIVFKNDDPTTAGKGWKDAPLLKWKENESQLDKELRTQTMKMQIEISRLTECNTRLIKENEELKKQIAELQAQPSTIEQQVKTNLILEIDRYKEQIADYEKIVNDQSNEIKELTQRNNSLGSYITYRDIRIADLEREIKELSTKQTNAPIEFIPELTTKYILQIENENKRLKILNENLQKQNAILNDEFDKPKKETDTD